jgi:AcrR family transcriptional regulator
LVRNSKEKLIENAKLEILENGFNDASLRKIVKMSGVTTGAFYAHFSDKAELFECLVQPVIDAFADREKVLMEKYKQLLDENKVDHESLWKISGEILSDHVEHIFKHFDEYKMFLLCSAGTKYENYMDGFIDASVDASMEFFKAMKTKGIKVNLLEKWEMHILTHSHYSALYEIIKHDMSKEQAERYLKTITNFYVAGWKSVLGMD